MPKPEVNVLVNFSRSLIIAFIYCFDADGWVIIDFLYDIFRYHNFPMIFKNCKCSVDSVAELNIYLCENIFKTNLF